MKTSKPGSRGDAAAARRRRGSAGPRQGSGSPRGVPPPPSGAPASARCGAPLAGRRWACTLSSRGCVQDAFRVGGPRLLRWPARESGRRAGDAPGMLAFRHCRSIGPLRRPRRERPRFHSLGAMRPLPGWGRSCLGQPRRQRRRAAGTGLQTGAARSGIPGAARAAHGAGHLRPRQGPALDVAHASP